MVVIVIRAPPRDSGELASSSVTYTRTTSKEETERYSPNGPPSYDSGVTLDHEPRDLKVYLRESKPYSAVTLDPGPRDRKGYLRENRPYSRVTSDPETRDFKVYLRENKPIFDRDHFLESSSKDSGYVEYQRLRDLELLKEVHERSKGDLRLDSPASKDSGFSERPRGYKVTRIKYHPRPERTPSCTYLSSNSSENAVTYCPSSSSQADPDNQLATTKEGKFF